MYYIEKTIEAALAHSLTLDYESKCSRVHGHNAIITVYCRSKELDQNGMVVDFSEVKRLVKDTLDHRFLNEVFDFNPTAENTCHWLCDHIPNCYKVSLRESIGNLAIYERDD